ncbi:unnamed protein product [Caenorhabditis angaria]|uniref:CWH43-like N-terminal domain-containing protein n=1 Tax=Caenorhabditis angaria TaxID=860376 RepID=A0A9P1IF43_9PELO|nr:unnamed protein product [Caenorhabditis angaria]
MAIINIWLFPIFIAIYSILTLLICVILSINSHHFPANWPFLSDFTKFQPAKNAYTIMSNHILLFLLIWMYLKHRELKSYFRQANQSIYYEKISWANLLIGICAISCYQLAVNFPATKVAYFELFGNRISLCLGLIYIWIHSFLSLNVRDENLNNLPIFLMRICLGSVVLSFLAAMIQANKLAKPNQTLCAIYEWCCYFSFAMFLLTDSYEFRFMVFRPPKLIIRGCSGYNPRVFESTDVSEEDEIPNMSQRFVM